MLKITTKRLIVRYLLFLLIQCFILLSALIFVYFYIGLPLIKKAWTNIIYNYNNIFNDVCIKYKKNMGLSLGPTSSTSSLEPIESKNKKNVLEGFFRSIYETLKQKSHSNNKTILENNKHVRDKAIRFSVVISIAVFLITMILIYFSKYEYTNIFIHSIPGFIVVGLCYGLYGRYFIGEYDTLDTQEFIKNIFVHIHNCLNPNDQIN